jgi:hypothetical protein
VQKSLKKAFQRVLREQMLLVPQISVTVNKTWSSHFNSTLEWEKAASKAGGAQLKMPLYAMQWNYKEKRSGGW